MASTTTWQGLSAAERIDDLDARERGVRVGLRARGPSARWPASDLRDGVLRLGRGAGLRVEHQRAHAALREHLHDAAAHGAAAGDAGDQVAAVNIEHGGTILEDIIPEGAK